VGEFKQSEGEVLAETTWDGRDAPHPVIPSSRHPVIPSSRRAVRAWLYLVWLCCQRQARAHQMVWIALALLGLSTAVVGLNTAAGRWGMGHWRGLRRPGQSLAEWRQSPTYQQALDGLAGLRYGTPWVVPAAASGQDALLAAYGVLLSRSGFLIFSKWVVFSIFLSFLLPLWSLSFATEALGGEREGRNLIWLLTRPLSRPAIYLAKYVAVLPWCLGLNLGGFALLCLAAGRPGHLAFSLYWPAVLWGTMAFTSLYHLMGACFRRSVVVAIVYSFFLETILGNMPGYLKRVSLSFYTRCLMFDVAKDHGMQPEQPSVYLPVDGLTAWWVLAGLTAALLVLGMTIFSRSEYQDLN
jgi:ABC-type transport system involved in multi-copper enzyme maturation permease subunit